jgi:chemotaxis protein MotA
MKRHHLIPIGLGALVLVLCAILLWSGSGLTLINLPGLVLVAGGTFLASAMSHSVPAVMDLLRRLPRLIRETGQPLFHDGRAFVQVAALYRRGDVRGAERASGMLHDLFLREGAQLALDPHNGEELARVLQWRIRRQKEHDGAEVRILRTMATFAPAFGMLGTLFGLVSLLGDLGKADLHWIGLTMGFALMSTLYGMLAANLLLRPLALKLEDRSRARLSRMAFLMEAVIMLYERQHPTLIGDYLGSELPPASGPADAPDNVRSLAFGRA